MLKLSFSSRQVCGALTLMEHVFGSKRKKLGQDSPTLVLVLLLLDAYDFWSTSIVAYPARL